MYIQIYLSYQSIQITSMYSSKKQLSTDDQDNTSLNKSDVDSPIRTYALIETDPDELDHIIDLLRQFFPKTKIIEYNNQSHLSHTITSQYDDQTSPSTSSQVRKF